MPLKIYLGQRAQKASYGNKPLLCKMHNSKMPVLAQIRKHLKPNSQNHQTNKNGMKNDGLISLFPQDHIRIGLLAI